MRLQVKSLLMATKNMATKNVTARRSKVPCGVCQAPIIDGRDEALLCEGECGLWLHRGCASVPPSRYQSLSTSDEPFVCLCCSNYQLKKELAQLKTELNGALTYHQKMSDVDLFNTVEALRMDVVQLKKTVSVLSAELSSTVAEKDTAARGYRLAAASYNRILLS